MAADPPREFLFDAFASYATDPDRELVRDIEAFLESLGRNPLVAPAYRRSLELCVDGSDFSLPRRGRRRAGGEPADEVFDLIRAYLEKCRSFVLFVGPRSSRHPWINRELAWWMENRDPGDILIAVTHGRDPKGEREQTFPEAILEAGLDREIWVDLRGFRKETGLVAVRDYEEERLRLSAALMGPEVSAGTLIAGWQRAAARQRRRRRLFRGLAGAAALAGAMALGWALLRWRDSSREARASDLALVSQQSSGADANRRLDGLVYAASSLAEEPSALGTATLIQAAQSLPTHISSITHDRGDKAADLVRFLADDRLVISAGFTKVLQFAAMVSGQVVGKVDLSGRARGIAVHPDRPLIAVATQGGLDLVAYVPLATGAAPRVVGRAAPGSRVQAVVFEPGGETLIAGAFDGTLARYRVADAGPSWQPVETVRLTDADGAGVGVSGLVLDPVAGRLAVSGILGTIDCLELGDWTRRSGSLEHSSEIFAMVSSPDGRLAAAADADGGILLFRPAGCEATGRIAPPVTEGTVARGLDGRLRGAPRSERAFTGISFSPDGSLIGVASHDRTARIYGVEQGVLTHVLVHPAMARAVAFSPSRQLVATGDNEGRIEIWGIGATVESWRIAGVEAFAVDPGGRWVAAWADRSLGIVAPASGLLLARQSPAGESFEGGARALVPTPDGAHLAVRLWSSTRAFVWDLSSLGRIPPPRPLQHPNVAGNVANVAALASGPAGLVTGERHQGRAVRLWSTAPAQRHALAMEGEVHAVGLDREIAAAVDVSGLVRVFAAASGKTLGEIRLPGAPQAFALAPGGRHLFLGFQGRERRGGYLCRIGDGALGCRSVFPGLTPTRALFSPRGDAVAVAIAGRQLDEGSLFLLRERDRWQPSLLSSAGLVLGLDFTGDGALLAAGGQSRSAEIFDLERNAKIAEVPLPNPVLDLRFLPGPEHRLLTLDGPEVGILRLWDWRPESLIAAACARWPRSFIPVRNPALPEPRSRADLCRR